MTRMYEIWNSTWNNRTKGRSRTPIWHTLHRAFKARGWDDGAFYTGEWMFRALQAIRGICKKEDIAQYSEDICSIAEQHMCEDDVKSLLRLSKFDNKQVRAWFDYASDKCDMTVTEDDVFMPKDNAAYCEYYEQYYSNSDDFVDVKVGRRTTERWCQSACDNNAFYCDVSEEWYSGGHYSQSETSNGDVICSEIAGDYGYSWSSERDAFVHEDEEDEEDEYDGIPKYHKAFRNWAYTIPNRSTRAFYGFEIEVEFQDREAVIEFYNDKLDGNGSRSFCAERDGSLDDVLGLEVITRPFPMQELQTPGNPLQAMLATMKESGAFVPHSSYGLHITTNWSRLSLDHGKRLRDLVYGLRHLTVFVSQREVNSASFENHHGKHTAMCVRCDDAIEMRTFKSTTDYDMLMSYVEYLEALTEWSRDPQRNTSSSEFRFWVVNTTTYPHLAKRFLGKKEKVCASPSLNLPGPVSGRIPSGSASETTPTAPDTPYVYPVSALSISERASWMSPAS